MNLRVLDCFNTREGGLVSRSHGEALVTSLVTMFKKMHLETGESIGWGKVHLPELEMHTTAYWMAFEEDLVRRAGGTPRRACCSASPT